MDLALLAFTLLFMSAFAVWSAKRIVSLQRRRKRPSKKDWALFFVSMSGALAAVTVIGGSMVLKDSAPWPTRGTDDPGFVDEAISKAFRNLSPASIAFNAPKKMNLDDTTGIELLLSLTESVERLQKQLREPGRPQGAQIRAGAEMEVTLRPARKDAFDVVPVLPERQTLHPAKPTRWAWRVTPLEGGQQELHLTVAAPAGNGKALMTMTTYSHIIVVNVTPWKHVTRFGKNNWQWLWTALLLPVAGWLWKRSRRRPTYDG